MEFNREDKRKLIYYCWRRGLPTSDICKEINSTLGKDTVSLRMCADWVAKFKSGEMGIHDKQREGRPSYDIDDEIQALLDQDKNVTTRRIACELNIAQETARTHLLKMGKRYLCNVWVPHLLTDAAKQKRVEICTELLRMYQQDNFLHQLVTGDELWVYWENQASATHKSWRGAGDDIHTESRQKLTVKKHMATVFWDQKGIILTHVLPNGQTMTAAMYCSILDELKVAIQQKRRRRITDGRLRLLHDNARPHTAQSTQGKLKEIGLQLLPHPPYSPDLAPSDYYLFSPMKSSLRGKVFHNAEEAQEAIDLWVAPKDQNFFATGINNLPDRWQRCIDHGGNYFEHLKDTDE